MNCKWCDSQHVHKDGGRNGFQRYRCMECGKRYTTTEVYEKKNVFINHFGVKLKKTDRNILTRENYCEASNKIDSRQRKVIQRVKRLCENDIEWVFSYPSIYREIPNDVFADEDHYTDTYVKKHYDDCMKNFDLNMHYFENLNYDEFNYDLMKFVKENKFVEIMDLDEVAEKRGIYIMVLDKYKQVYIGATESERGIKGRIMNHWSRKKEFSRLIFGKVETSVLSIDAFGALDTTRIFYKELKWYQQLYEYEAKCVGQFKSKYRLNRVAGGINEEKDTIFRDLQLVSTMQNRKLIYDEMEK